jgi:hypothetical protein
VDISFKNVILLLSGSFMVYINLPLLLLGSTKTTCPTFTSILFDVEYIVFKEKTGRAKEEKKEKVRKNSTIE